MSTDPPPFDRDAARRRIVRKMRELREARGWTQAQLAERLGLSQGRLSVIERGGGGISAEQLLALMALLNVPIDEFLPRQDPEDEIQNALARLGAFHLRQVPGILPSARVREVTDAVREVLVWPRSARLVTALAPALVRNIDSANLDLLFRDLGELGRDRRLGWLAECIVTALESVDRRLPADWAASGRRAVLVLDDLATRISSKHRSAGLIPERSIDYFDPAIRSAKTRDSVWRNAGPVARRWGIATEIDPSDFERALLEAVRG